MKRLFLIALNVAMIVFYFVSFVLWSGDANGTTKNETQTNQSTIENESNLDAAEMPEEGEDILAWITKQETNNGSINFTSRFFHIDSFGSFAQNIRQGFHNSDDFKNLKPILKMLMAWLLYVCICNAVLTLIYNLVFGGAFLRHFVSIKEFALLDRNKSLGIGLILSSFPAIVVIRLMVIWIYQKDLLMMVLFPNEAQEGEFALLKQRIALINLLAEMLISVIQGVLLSMGSVWFIYAMIMYRRCIESLHAEVKKGKNN